MTKSLSLYRAFSLLEILVVLAVISLLAAILFPVFSRAREAAQRSSCANNQKQVLQALAQYTMDYEGFYMPQAVGLEDKRCFSSSWGVPPEELQKFRLFSEFLVPYAANKSQVFLCPDFADVLDNDNDGATCEISGREMKNIGLAYTQRTELSIGPDLRPVHVDSISNPSEIDSIRCFSQFHGTDIESRWLNVGFLDGHVKGYSRAAFVKSQKPILY